MKMKYIYFIPVIFWGCTLTAQENNGEMKDDYAKVSEKLDSIYQTDQEGRFELIALKNKMDNAPADEKEALQNKFATLIVAMKKNDSLNLKEVEGIINDYGWLGPGKIGGQASQAMFLVIQHADLEIQKKYLPVIREAADKGETSKSNFALLEDRIAIREGKEQLYGSQVWIDPVTNKYYVDLLSDPDNVDERRAEVGLPPMGVYLKQAFDMEWDPEDYKRNILPKLKDLKTSRKK